MESQPPNFILTDPGINYFLPGQVWQYETRPGDEGSTLTVLKIDEPNGNVIIHVRIDGIMVNNKTFFIEHFAFSAAALMASITGFIKHLDTIPPFEEAYQQWKQLNETSNASYSKIPVKEVIDSLSFGRENGAQRINSNWYSISTAPGSATGF